MAVAGRREQAALKRLGALALLLGAGMVVLIAYALHGAMQFNVAHLPLEENVQTQRWLPQGWAFFTRDPQEERLFVLRRDDHGRWVSASLAPHGRPENAFGMNRVSRAQGVELGQLYERIKKSDFMECKQRVETCLDELRVKTTLDNRMPRKTLCGPIGIIKRKPLPWAWSAWEHRAHMPARVVRLEVQC